MTGRVARVALGHGHEVAGIVYGTVVAMATLTAAYANVKDPWELAAIVWTTLFVLWIAHLYSHGLGESMARGRRLDGAELKSVARRELAILLAAAGPSVPLLLGALGVLRLEYFRLARARDRAQDPGPGGAAVCAAREAGRPRHACRHRRESRSGRVRRRPEDRRHALTGGPRPG